MDYAFKVLSNQLERDKIIFETEKNSFITTLNDEDRKRIETNMNNLRGRISSLNSAIKKLTDASN